MKFSSIDKAAKNGNNRTNKDIGRKPRMDMEERQMNEQWAAYQQSEGFAARVATLYGAGTDVLARQKERYGKLV